jgi:hypothetical protein
VRAGLESVRLERRDVLPEDLALDALAPEAALLLDLGDAAGAAAWLDPTLSALPQAGATIVASAIRSASLVAALRHRALAAAALRQADDTRFFGTAVSILWSSADPFLQSRVREVAGLARAASP